MSIAKRSLATIVALFISISAAQADDYEFYDFESGRLYAGGGLSYNLLSTWRSVSYDDAIGVQGFFGWDFFRFRDFTISGEAGAFYSGAFKYSDSNVRLRRSFSGPYVNAVGRYPLSDMVWVQARLGGSAISGIGSEVIGGGFGFRITPSISIRTEAVSYGFGDINSVRAEALVTF